jgi:hypothetical protein
MFKNWERVARWAAVSHAIRVRALSDGDYSMNTTFDPRLTAYFGEVTLGAGFLPTPHLFLRHYVDLGLDSVLAMFVLQLMETTWDLGEPPRTSRDFAQRMGVGTKAIQRYTSRIEALGLVNVSAQFDASGAQVENRYDLSPLFTRLAALVADRPCYQERRRQSSCAPQQPAPVLSPSQDDGLDIANLAHPASTPDHTGDHSRRRGRGSIDRGAGDRSIAGPGIDRSGLKETQRIINKQQDHAMHDAWKQQGTVDQEHQDVGAPPAWSIRQQRALGADDVASSQTLLARMAIDNPVRTRIAERMAPEDVWALRVYSVAKGWSPALTVSQVYDKHQKLVQVASDLEQPHYELGSMLAALDPETAEAALDLVMQCCPDEPQRFTGAPLFQSAPPPVLSVLKSLWAVVAQLRGCPQIGLPDVTSCTNQKLDREHGQLSDSGQIWQAVLRDLQLRIPQTEFLTWLESSVLLDLDDQSDRVHAVIGVANTFARDRVIGTYLSLLEETLATVLQKRATIQVELATSQTLLPTCNTPIPVDVAGTWATRRQPVRQRI